jgi:hypothetical protein
MRRKLTETEKEQIRAERLDREQKAFPSLDIDVFVEDWTYANEEPIVRVVRRAGNPDK